MFLIRLILGRLILENTKLDGDVVPLTISKRKLRNLSTYNVEERLIPLSQRHVTFEALHWSRINMHFDRSVASFLLFYQPSLECYAKWVSCYNQTLLQKLCYLCSNRLICENYIFPNTRFRCRKNRDV